MSCSESCCIKMYHTGISLSDDSMYFTMGIQRINYTRLNALNLEHNRDQMNERIYYCVYAAT